AGELDVSSELAARLLLRARGRAVAPRSADLADRRSARGRGCDEARPRRGAAGGHREGPRVRRAGAEVAPAARAAWPGGTAYGPAGRPSETGVRRRSRRISGTRWASRRQRLGDRVDLAPAVAREGVHDLGELRVLEPGDQERPAVRALLRLDDLGPFRRT